MQERWRRHINTGCGSIPVCVSHEAERWLCFPASPNKDKCCGGCRQGRRGGEKEDRDGEMDTKQAAASVSTMYVQCSQHQADGEEKLVHCDSSETTARTAHCLQITWLPVCEKH